MEHYVRLHEIDEVSAMKRVCTAILAELGDTLPFPTMTPNNKDFDKDLIERFNVRKYFRNREVVAILLKKQKAFK